MSVRDYAVLYLGGKPSRPSGGTVLGGNAILGAGAHRLDGPEHTAPGDTTTLDATTARHGLLPKLSGDPDEALRGDGSWGAVTAEGALDVTDGTVTVLAADEIEFVFGPPSSGYLPASEDFTAAGGTPETVTLAAVPLYARRVWLNGSRVPDASVGGTGDSVEVDTTAGDQVTVDYEVAA